MSEIFVPIDFSPAKNLIPPGEDIVYSTLCRTQTVALNLHQKWVSHVLMTTKGLVFTKPAGRIRPETLYYLPWSFIKGIYKKRFQWGQQYFHLVREPNFETKQGFKLRCKEFQSKIRPIQKEGAIYWKTNFPSKKERKAELKRIVDLSESKRDT